MGPGRKPRKPFFSERGSTVLNLAEAEGDVGSLEPVEAEGDVGSLEPVEAEVDVESLEPVEAPHLFYITDRSKAVLLARFSLLLAFCVSVSELFSPSVCLDAFG